MVALGELFLRDGHGAQDAGQVQEAFKGCDEELDKVGIIPRLSEALDGFRRYEHGSPCGMRVDVDFLAARSKGLLGHATLQDAFELRFLKLAGIQQALRVFDRTHFLPAFLRMFSTAFVICSVV